MFIQHTSYLLISSKAFMDIARKYGIGEELTRIGTLKIARILPIETQKPFSGMDR